MQWTRGEATLRTPDQPPIRVSRNSRRRHPNGVVGLIRASRFLGFGGPLVVTALLLNAVAAHAFGPYTGGQVGYDVSYPQCPGTSAPPAPNGITWNFGIIGTNHGRPLTPPPAG